MGVCSSKKSVEVSGNSTEGSGGGHVSPLEEKERRRLSVSTVVGKKPGGVSVRKFSDPVLALINEKDGLLKKFNPEMTMQLIQASPETVAIFGAPPSQKESSFQCKGNDWGNIQAKDGAYDHTHTRFNKLGVGMACHKGLKPESPNQDDYLAIRTADWTLYGVFDGHGPFGHDASNLVHLALPFLILGDEAFEDKPLMAMEKAFRKVHHLLEAASEQDPPLLDSSLSGTTATVVLHRDGCLYTAHVGDSRAVVGRKAGNSKLTAIELTEDHKPILPAEKRRIEACGGEVRRLEGDIPHRVFVKNRMYPGLAMSRAIGDTIASVLGVVCDPEVTKYELNPGDQFVVICSDGVWEFLSSQDVVDRVAAAGPENVQQAAEDLSNESWQCWLKEEENIVDDITVIIAWLPNKGGR